MNCRNLMLQASAAALAVVVGCTATAENKPASENTSPGGTASGVWTQDSFDDFSRGTLGDGGQNTYVSADGAIKLVNRFDLNRDGYIDQVFANSHPQAEKLDQVIYWGNGKDFDGSRKTLVPNEGAQWTVAADLDDDGKTDIVIPSYANGTWSKMESSVYYGDPAQAKARGADSDQWTNYPFVKKISLPTEAAQQAAVADLNKDGHPDIVFALSSGFWEYRGGDALASPSRIFWGSKDGYDRDKSTDIEAAGASDVAIADLNDDSWPDLVFANREKQGKHDTESFVYFGGSDGFSPTNRAELPTKQVNAVAIADVNGDKQPDILFANGQGDASYIYLNQNGQFDAGRRIELPTSDARDVAAADVNGDGATDVFITNHQTAKNRLTESYLYVNDGKGNFSPENRQEFQTVGAWGASIADLNEDDRPEIIVSNFQEHESFEVPSYIYWNSKDGFDQSRRTSLFTKGAVGNTVADFDNDGHLDVMFNNTSSRYRGGVGPAFVYWGVPDGKYTTQKMQKLPSVEPYDWAAGDLDNDGWPDLLLANMAEIGRRIQENYVYWGGKDRFSVDRRTALMGKGSRGISVADLDENGWLDVICLNTNVTPTDENLAMFIYWGEPHGFVTHQRTEIPAGGNGLPLAADFNHDGNLDLVTTGGTGKPTWIYWGDGTRNYSPQRRSDVPGSEGVSSCEAADMNQDGWLDLLLMRRGNDVVSSVYYGNEKGEFSVDRRDEFRPYQTQGATVADVNGDGWLDVICGRYSDQGSRATMSPIYLGSSNGISEENKFLLPTNAGTGSQVADYNRDGYADLLFYCHRSEGDPNRPGQYGDHVTESFLYWGGPDGFSPKRRHLIPSEGVHYDGGVDIGNIKDRSLQFDYISPPHQYGSDRAPQRIEWQADTPHGSSVRMQVRTAAERESLDQAQWRGADGAGSFYNDPSGAQLTSGEGDRWIQYRAVLVSPYGGAAPSLERVRVHFD